MPSKSPAQRLKDIVDNIDAIAAFSVEVDFTSFRNDRKTVYAVVRALVSELLPPSRNRMVGYRRPPATFGAWHTVQHSLATLRAMAAAEFVRYRSTT